MLLLRCSRSHLDLGHLLRGERLEVSGVLRVSLPTGWTQTIALRTEFVPTETTDLNIGCEGIKLESAGTDLISTSAGIKVDVVQL